MKNKFSNLTLDLFPLLTWFDLIFIFTTAYIHSLLIVYHTRVFNYAIERDETSLWDCTFCRFILYIEYTRKTTANHKYTIFHSRHSYELYLGFFSQVAFLGFWETFKAPFYSLLCPINIVIFLGCCIDRTCHKSWIAVVWFGGRYYISYLPSRRGISLLSPRSEWYPPRLKAVGDIILTKGDKSDIPRSARLDDDFILSFVVTY